MSDQISTSTLRSMNIGYPSEKEVDGYINKEDLPEVGLARLEIELRVMSYLRSLTEHEMIEAILYDQSELLDGYYQMLARAELLKEKREAEILAQRVTETPLAEPVPVSMISEPLVVQVSLRGKIKTWLKNILEILLDIF